MLFLLTLRIRFSENACVDSRCRCRVARVSLFIRYLKFSVVTFFGGRGFCQLFGHFVRIVTDVGTHIKNKMEIGFAFLTLLLGVYSALSLVLSVIFKGRTPPNGGELCVAGNHDSTRNLRPAHICPYLVRSEFNCEVI